MRIIKFRSWDWVDRRMDIPDKIANGIDGDVYKIQQYTGLKDKQGKEIYEGDIVRVSKKNPVIYDIVWHPDLAKYTLHENYQGRESWLSPFARVIKYEVIGNIYETEV